MSNTLPVIASVSIAPLAPLDTDTLTCNWAYTDPDPQSDLSTVEWTMGSTVLGTGFTLSSGFNAGDTVTCTVTAFDGVATGNVDSASVTIGASNTAPSVLSVAISPDPATELDTLTAVPSGWDDPDGDPEEYLYEWLVDGSPISNTPTLASSDFRWFRRPGTGDPWDGQVYGSPVASSPLTIGDSCVPGGAWAQTNGLCLADYRFTGGGVRPSGLLGLSAGDVDGDGIGDLLIAASQNDGGGADAARPT